MANWADFFYGIVAGSSMTIIGMCAATYAIWLAFVAGISGHARKAAETQGEGPWDA